MFSECMPMIIVTLESTEHLVDVGLEVPCYIAELHYI
jgi:hypothetical protein